MKSSNQTPLGVMAHTEGQANRETSSSKSIPIDKSVSQAPLLESLRYIPLPPNKHYPEGEGYSGWNTPPKAQQLDRLVREKAIRQRGVYLGAQLGNSLVDVDLDFWKTETIPHALKQRLQQFALETLPHTEKMFGRNEQTVGHLLYRCPDLTQQKNLSLGDPLVVELRCEGQTMENGWHPNAGREIYHHRVGEPAEIPWRELTRAVGFFSAVAMTAVRWTKGERHDLSLHLTGYLVKRGVPETEIERFLTALAQVTEDEELRSRKRDLKSALAKEEKSSLAGLGRLLHEGKVSIKWANDFETAVGLWTGLPIPATHLGAVQEPEDDYEAVLTDVADIQTEYADPIVPGLIYRGRVTIIAGDSGIGKTTLLLQILHAMGTGEPLWGKHPIPRLKVGWVDEDHPWSELKETLENHYQWNPSGLCYRFRFRNKRDGELEVLPLSQTAYDQYKHAILNNGLDLLVIDTLGDWTNPKDINDDGEARTLMNLIRKLSRETDCAVVLLHHLNKKLNEPSLRALSGSARWVTKTDVGALLVWQNKTQGLVQLIVDKDRFGEAWQATFQRDGKQRRLIPVDQTELPASPKDALVYWLATREHCTIDEAHQYLQTAGYPKSKEAVKKILQRLHEQRLLKRTEDGFPRKTYYSLATKPAVRTSERANVPTVPTVPTEPILNSFPVGTQWGQPTESVPTGGEGAGADPSNERGGETIYEGFLSCLSSVSPPSPRCSGDSCPHDVPTGEGNFELKFAPVGTVGTVGTNSRPDVPPDVLSTIRAAREAEGLGYDESIIATLYQLGAERGFPQLPPVEGIWFYPGEDAWLDVLTTIDLPTLARIAVALRSKEVA